METETTAYALTGTAPGTFEEALALAREALASEGFGVLCEIDAQATLREKLGVEVDRYTILGACNPPLAHRALGAEPDVGVFLPCNVVVYLRDGVTHVSAVDAERLLSLVGREHLESIATDVKERFARVVARACGVGAGI